MFNQAFEHLRAMGIVASAAEHGARRRHVPPEAAPLRMVIAPRMVRDFVKAPGACPEIVKRWGLRVAI